MSREKQPDYDAMAERLTPRMTEYNDELARIEAEIRVAEQVLQTLEERKSNTTAAKNDIYFWQLCLRELQDGVRTRQEIAQQTAAFPLINAVNQKALEMIWGASAPEEFFRVMGEGDVNVLFIPPYVESVNIQILRSSNGQAKPMAVVHVGRFGETQMVLFDQGITGATVPAVVMTIGYNGMIANETEYKVTRNDARIILVGNLAEPTIGRKFTADYSSPDAENQLAGFLGEGRYQAALSLLQPAETVETL